MYTITNNFNKSSSIWYTQQISTTRFGGKVDYNLGWLLGFI